mmetsp:Transcript_22629/g.40730  ORF Transcript_22629/g.40730 Transcript_22629/m.40730 type:complete len:224 (-) Transcript_22629:1042-1713(-)
MKDPCEEVGFICNSSSHWIAIRKIAGTWFNLNSLADGPSFVSDFYLTALLESVKEGGFVVFVVRGEFPSLSREQFEARQDHQMWFPLSMFVKKPPTQTDDIDRAIKASLEAFDDQDEIQRAIQESLLAQSAPPPEDFGEVAPEADAPDAFELRVRIWDGTTHTRKFNPSDTLASVKSWIQVSTQQRVKLMSTYPMQELTALDATLELLGVGRNSNLLRAERAL